MTTEAPAQPTAPDAPGDEAVPARAAELASEALRALDAGGMLEAEASFEASYQMGGQVSVITNPARRALRAGRVQPALWLYRLAYRLAGSIDIAPLEVASQRALDEHRYEDAILLMRGLYDLGGGAKEAANVGRVHLALGRRLEAADWLQRFIREAPDHPKAPIVRRMLASMGAELAKGHVFLRLTSTPPAATVTLEGQHGLREPGSTPLEVWVPLGVTELTLRHAGYREVTRTFDAIEHGPHALELELTPLPGTLKLTGIAEGALVFLDGARVEGPAIDAVLRLSVSAGSHHVRVEHGGAAWSEHVDVAPAASLELAVDVSAQPPSVPVDAAVSRGFEAHPAAWVAGGITIVSLATALSLGGVALDRANDARSYGADPTHDPDEWRRRAHMARDLGLAANVTYGVTGAAALTSLVLFFALPPGDDPATGSTVTPITYRGGAGVRARVRF